MFHSFPHGSLPGSSLLSCVFWAKRKSCVVRVRRLYLGVRISSACHFPSHSSSLVNEHDFRGASINNLLSSGEIEKTDKVTGDKTGSVGEGNKCARTDRRWLSGRRRNMETRHGTSEFNKTKRQQQPVSFPCDCQGRNSDLERSGPRRQHRLNRLFQDPVDTGNIK